jgi:abortive infection bacteriophage resistance protein
MREYTNPPISREEQLEVLLTRGLLVTDKHEAVKYLDSINYFRLACYLQPFESPTSPLKYKEGTSFSRIIEIYRFDKDLRELIFSAIQDVEIALRSRIIHHFSMAHGSFWFLNRKLFKDSSIFNATLQKLWSEVGRSKEDFIEDFFDRYDSPILPPVWKTLEVASFGVLSKIFENFSEVTVKKAVARDFGLPQYKYLESWIRSITVLRNCCAHHSRTWNRRYPWKPQMPATLPCKWISDATDLKPYKVYSQLCCLQYLCSTISAAGNFCDGIKNLIIRYPSINISTLGFPASWSSEPLWEGC